MLSTSNSPFIRVRFTWLAYAMLAFYSYLQALIGVVTPLLRQELALSYGASALHVSAFALGLILSGALGEHLAQTYGRRFVFWGGGLGMAVGALIIAVARTVWFTLPGAFIMGLCGSLLLMLIQAGLSEQHGEQRTIALTEANVAASLCAFLAPVLIGVFQGLGLGWRSAIWLALAAVALLNLRFGREPMPNAQVTSSQPDLSQPVTHHPPLPAAFWAYWTVLFLGVAVEWCMVTWGGDFLQQMAALTSAQAASLVGLFLLAMFLGRIGGALLARRMAAATLLLSTIILALTGFPLFWLAPTQPLMLIGFFLTGLGTGSFFPLAMAVANSVAPAQANQANARVVLGIGLSVLSTPLILGWVADQMNLQNAYGVVAVILVVAVVLTYVTNRTIAARHRLDRGSYLDQGEPQDGLSAPLH